MFGTLGRESTLPRASQGGVVHKRYLVLPTLNVTDHSWAFRSVLDYIADYRPEVVIQTGGLGPEATHDDVREKFSALIRSVHHAPVVVVRPILDRCATIAQDVGEHVVIGPMRIGSTWMISSTDDSEDRTHVPGQTALAIARRERRPVIVGHTGLLGIARHTVTSTDGSRRTVSGVEAGTLLATSGRHQRAHGCVTLETGMHGTSIHCVRVTRDRNFEIVASDSSTLTSTTTPSRKQAAT